MARKKVLLGHLNSMGDCLFATVIARQIKEVDYPDCHLTWAVNSKCKQVVLMNPYVDEIWEIETENATTSPEEWKQFVSNVEVKKNNGEFDFVFLTQIIGNLMRYDGGIRSSIYNNYPHKITVPHQPIIRLSETEIENVKEFTNCHKLEEYKRVILLECGPDSFDSALNPQTGYELALEITQDEDTAVILSSNKQLTPAHKNIIDASSLTFRENAELTKYCDLFIGCASGISWLTTTNWAKKLNMILVITQENTVFPSMIYDHEFINLPTDHIIEIKSNQDSIKKVLGCLNKISQDGFRTATSIYNEKIKLTNFDFLHSQIKLSLRNFDFKLCLSCLSRSIKRNGTKAILATLLRDMIFSFPYNLVVKFLKYPKKL
jgi:hypothetical protein